MFKPKKKLVFSAQAYTLRLIMQDICNFVGLRHYVVRKFNRGFPQLGAK